MESKKSTILLPNTIRNNYQEKVVLTGASDLHTAAIQLLERDYRVVGTLRNFKRADSKRSVKGKQANKTELLRPVEADLMDDQVWDKMTSNIDFVQHIASPFPLKSPKHKNDLILPAKTSTPNILKAAAANKVKRAVVTSSMAAITWCDSSENAIVAAGVVASKDVPDNTIVGGIPAK